MNSSNCRRQNFDEANSLLQIIFASLLRVHLRETEGSSEVRFYPRQEVFIYFDEKPFWNAASLNELVSFAFLKQVSEATLWTGSWVWQCRVVVFVVVANFRVNEPRSRNLWQVVNPTDFTERRAKIMM